MKGHDKKYWPGTGLMMAGTIVFLVGLTIILFKELNIPRHWMTAVIGAALVAAGVVIRGIGRPERQENSLKRS